MPSSNMDVKLRNEVWERDKGVCQICKRKLFETKIIDPYEGIAAELSVLKEIPILKWYKKCWNCQKETLVVSYYFTTVYSWHLGDIRKLDENLMQKYSFVKQTYSKKMGKEVIANTCVNCGSIQGNSYIRKDLDEMAADGKDTNELIDLVLPNNLTFEDLPIEKEEPKPVEVKLSIDNIHHKDGNWENNDLGNLILLCKDCHKKINSRQGKNVALSRSRKEARKEARVRKEKAQTDEWRRKYYALKKLKRTKRC